MKPKSHWFNRANISTHELTNPPLMCLWASDDVPLAGIGGQPQSRKLSVAIYRPIPADILYVQPLRFTTDRALVSELSSCGRRGGSNPQGEETTHPAMAIPQRTTFDQEIARSRSHRIYHRLFRFNQLGSLWGSAKARDEKNWPQDI